MAEVRNLVPGASKRREGEEFVIRAAVRCDGEPLVEAWIEGQRHVARRLNYSLSEDGWQIFEAAIAPKQAGLLTITCRARESGEQLWSWSEEKTELWVDPAWLSDAIVYNAFVRYFGARTVEEDGEIKEILPGRFDDVKREIAKLARMGINVLYLNPVHMIGELFRNYNPHDLLPDYLQPGCPYSIKDYKSIDPELSFGKDSIDEGHPFAEFKKLVDAAHLQGIRVVMDLVFNHSAHDSVFQRLHPEWYLYKEDIWSLEAPYLCPEDLKRGKPWGDPKHTFSPYDHGWWWRDAAQLNWNNLAEYPEFIMPQSAGNDPPQNPTITHLYAYFKNIVKFWIREFGIDGFRCDVAYRIPKGFWRECILEAQEEARSAHPGNGSLSGDVAFIAEDYHVDPKGLLESGFSACYGDYSNKLASLPELTGYLDYMYNISGNHFPDGTLFFIFPECHDFHRTPERIAKEMRKHHEDADLNANKSRWTVTACLPGIPMIFNGFEKIEWQQASLFSYSSVDWESDKDICEHIRQVNAIRRSEPCLQRGRYHYLHTSEGIAHESRLFSFARILGRDAIIVCVNLSVASRVEGVEVFVPDSLPFDPAREYVLRDLLTNTEYRRQGPCFKVILDPGEAHIFKVVQKK